MKKSFLIATFILASVYLLGVNIPVVKAATAEELLAQITAIQAQIASLQQQLTEIRGEAVWCYDFNVNLRYGDDATKLDVATLQKALNKEGLYKIIPQEDGYFGDFTASAVVQFQEKYASEILTPWGLTTGTGYVGSTTRAKLNKLYGCGAVSTFVPNYTVTPSSTLVRGQTYNFTVKISGGAPNSPILFYLQRPDRTMEYNGYGRVTDANGNYYDSKDANPITDASGSYRGTMTMKLTNEGQNGIWVSWATVGGVVSNKQYHNVVGANPTTPSITVLSPNGGERWEVGKSYNITWTSFPPGGVSSYVRIAILKNGQIIDQLGAGGVVNTGNYLWTITSPNIPGDNYKVKIYDINNNSIFDESDNYFSVVSSITQPTVGISSPNNGDMWQMGSAYNIIWFADNFTSSDKVNIILLDGRAGYSYYVIATDVPAVNPPGTYAGTPIGTYSWTVPATGIIPGSTNPFKIYIGKYKPAAQSENWEPLRASAESGIYGYGNNFSIVSTSTAPIINDIRPSSILQGQTLQVTLYGYNLGGASNTNGSCGLNPDALGGFVLGNCNIQPLFVSVGITAASNAITGDRQFTITTPSGISNPVKFTVLSSSINKNITVTSPNGEETWKTGETHRVTWTSQGIDKVAIYVYNDTVSGSGSTNYLDSAMTSLSVPAAQGYFDWTIVSGWLPKTTSGNEGRYKIRIDDVNADATGVRDSSDNYFSIVEAEPITVLSPNGGETLTVNSQNTIRWQSSGLASSTVLLEVRKGSSPYIMIYSAVPNTGSYAWTVPTGLAGMSDLKIRVTDQNNRNVFDESDNYFSVVSEGLGMENIDNQLASISKIVSELMRKINELMGR